MSDSPDEDAETYEIEIEYLDAGFSMNIPLQQWVPKIERDFATFEELKEFYRKDREELRNQLAEGFGEIDPDVPDTEPTFVIKNTPKQWQEDSEVAAQFLEIILDTLFRLGLSIIIEDEIEAQEDLIEQNLYKPAIVRQSAFYEDYIIYQFIFTLQDVKGESLSSKELDIIEQLGHQDRLRFARLFRILDEYEHAQLQRMAKLRNRVAHNSWSEFDDDDEADLRDTVEKIHEMLSEAREPPEQVVDEEDDWLGFKNVDINTQNLQLDILDALRQYGGEATINRLVETVYHAQEPVIQRIYRMKHMGYVSIDGDQVKIESRGVELLQDEFG
jgi:uncharacterized protein YutE (UPF0331/DUF86 family)